MKSDHPNVGICPRRGFFKMYDIYRNKKNTKILKYKLYFQTWHNFLIYFRSHLKKLRQSSSSKNKMDEKRIIRRPRKFKRKRRRKIHWSI